MSDRYKIDSHTKHRTLYHFTFIPEYQKQVVEGKLKKEEFCNDQHLLMY